jgi:hypothetical protein
MTPHGRKVMRALDLAAWITAHLLVAVILAFCLQIVPIVNAMENHHTATLDETAAGRALLARPVVKASIILGVLASGASLLLSWRAGPRPLLARHKWWAVVTAAAVVLIIVSGGVVSAGRYVSGLPPIWPHGEEIAPVRPPAPADRTGG